YAWYSMFFFFFFQAEDGIRDKLVTGVQTCALPISCSAQPVRSPLRDDLGVPVPTSGDLTGWAEQGVLLPIVGNLISNAIIVGIEIGRASCRERVQGAGGPVS